MKLNAMTLRKRFIKRSVPIDNTILCHAASARRESGSVNGVSIGRRHRLFQGVDKIIHRGRELFGPAVNHGQRLGAAAVRKRHRRQPLTGHFRQHQRLQQDGDARINLHHPLDRLHLVALVVRLKQVALPNGMVWNMVYDKNAPTGDAPSATHEQLWSRLKFFLDELIPVAEEAGVTLAATPTIRCCRRFARSRGWFINRSFTRS